MRPGGWMHEWQVSRDTGVLRLCRGVLRVGYEVV